MRRQTVPRIISMVVVLLIGTYAFAGEQVKGKIVEAGKGKMTMTDMDGKNRHGHDLAPDVKVTLNGKSAKLEDLKKGQAIEVTVEKRDGKEMVTMIAARTDQDERGTIKRGYQTPEKAGSAPTRASKLIGAPVKNAAGESLGKIEDIVMDPHMGTVRYAVLSFGGFLGIGDKWFAVPWESMTIQYDNEKKDKFHFVFNVDKDRLKNAPGFDKDNWPDFSNPKWSVEVDTFYGDK